MTQLALHGKEESCSFLHVFQHTSACAMVCRNPKIVAVANFGRVHHSIPIKPIVKLHLALLRHETSRSRAPKFTFLERLKASNDSHGGSCNLGLERCGVDAHATCCLVFGSHCLTCWESGVQQLFLKIRNSVIRVCGRYQARKKARGRRENGPITSYMCQEIA